MLHQLDHKRERCEEDAADSLDLVRRFVDLAMATDRYLDRSFWLQAAADAITEEPSDERRAIFLVAARRIHSIHRVTKNDRNAATRRLAALIRPIK